MKLRLLLLLLLGLFILTETAEAQRGKKYKPQKRSTSSKKGQTDDTVIGIRLGGTAATINTNENEYPVTGEYQFFPGLQGGLIINIAQNDTFSIQPEILFTQKGYHISGIYNDSLGNPMADSYLKVRRNYIEVPVLARLALGGEQTKFVVSGGPYAGYWISGDFERRNAAGDTAATHVFRNTSPEGGIGDNRLELGGVFGTGMQHVTPRGTFTLDLRYHFSLTDTNKYHNSRPDNTSKALNKYFSISLGYILRN